MAECPFCREIYSGMPDRCPHCGEDLSAVNAKKPQPVRAVKSKVVAALLAFFLGETGAHSFYLGYKKRGVIQAGGLAALIAGYACSAAAVLNDSMAIYVVSLGFLLCGAVIDLPSIPVNAPDLTQIGRGEGYSVTFYGRCNACLAKRESC